MALVWSRFAATGVVLLLAACGPVTSRVGDDLTRASLTQEGKGVALVTGNMTGRSCRLVSMMVGVRDQDGYRLVKWLKMHHARKAPIAEVELPAGEYHMIDFQCANGNHVARLGDPVAEGGFKRSYATFSVHSGEVVNIGAFQLRYLGQAPGSNTIHADVAVGDWTIDDLNRFKEQRPALYAQMKTRLMHLNRPALLAGRPKV